MSLLFIKALSFSHKIHKFSSCKENFIAEVFHIYLLEDFPFLGSNKIQFVINNLNVLTMRTGRNKNCRTQGWRYKCLRMGGTPLFILLKLWNPSNPL